MLKSHWIGFAVGSVLSLNAGAALSQTTFEDYQTPEGFLTDKQHPTEPSGNSLLFTAEKYVYIHSRGLSNWKDVNDYYELMAKVQFQPGLYRRTPLGRPFSQDAEAQDDYIGIAAASYFVRTYHARDICNWGVAHDWNFSLDGHYEFPKYWDWQTWLGRSPAFVAHIKWAADVKPTYFQRIAWALAVATSGLIHPDAQDPWILTWLMVQTHDHRTWLGDQAARFWRWRLNRKWGSIEKVFARYFNDPNHPLANPARYIPCPEGTIGAERSPELVMSCQPK